MALTRAQVVDEAMTWIGTPWHHQAHTKGVGCDCGGLVRGVLVSLGVMPDNPEQWPGAQEYAGYSMGPDGRAIKACDAFLERINFSDVQIGDLLLCGWKSQNMVPRHIGILTDATPGRMYWIHSENWRKKQVAMSRLILDPRGMQLVQAYRIPGVA